MYFNPDLEIPELSSKVILVTGGSDGLGKETILQLSKHNPSRIYLAARNRSKAEIAITEIESRVLGAKISFLELDLSSFESIKQGSSVFSASSARLDILINNAGIMAVPPGLTKDGYEIQFGTNHLGHALLTKLLLPKLRETASKPEADVRIITLTSSAHAKAPQSGCELDNVKTDMQSSSTWDRYAYSKLANIHWNRELARHYPELKCVAIHPGSVNTNITSGPKASYPLLGWLIWAINKYKTISVQEGALNQLWAATAPKHQVKSGIVYYPIGVEGQESTAANDDTMAKELWKWTEEQLKKHI